MKMYSITGAISVELLTEKRLIAKIREKRIRLVQLSDFPAQLKLTKVN